MWKGYAMNIRLIISYFQKLERCVKVDKLTDIEYTVYSTVYYPRPFQPWTKANTNSILACLGGN